MRILFFFLLSAFSLVARSKTVTVAMSGPTLTQDEILKSLFAKPPKALKFHAEEVPFAKGSLVVAFLANTEEGPAPESLHFYVLRFDAGKLQKLAEWHQDLDFPATTDLNFDFGPYWMQKNRRAFGLRVREKSSEVAGTCGKNSSTEENLVLFDAPEGMATPILNYHFESAMRAGAQKSGGDCEVSESTTTAKLSNDKTAHQGFFDWTIRKNEKVTTTDKNGKNADTEVNEAHFQWNGKAYGEAK